MQQKNRTIFIWDIHWCYKEFKSLLKKLNIKNDDQIFLTWDIINKWPKSYKVLKYVYQHKNQIKLVKWNNEVDFLNYVDWDIKYSNKNFIKLLKKIKDKHELFLIDYIKNLPLIIEKDNFLLIHAWLNVKKILWEHNEFELTNIRYINNELWYKKYTWEKIIIYWHNAVDWLQIREKTIWIDSWCVYWKSLTAYILETKEIYTQNAFDIYKNVYED